MLLVNTKFELSKYLSIYSIHTYTVKITAIYEMLRSTFRK